MLKSLSKYLQYFFHPHHGRNLVKALQELNNLGLVGWFHSGEAAGLSDSDLLIVRSEVIEFTTREGLAGDILILPKDANATTDGHRSAFVVTCKWGNKCLKRRCWIFYS